jgi:anti-sigma-K factor RskA
MMHTHRDEHLDLCAALVLGALDEADRAELEAHRATGCAQCEREIAALQEAARALAESSPAAAPAPGLRARTLAAIAETPQSPAVAAAPRVLPLPSRPRSAWTPWVLAAAACLLAVSTVALWREGTRLRGELAEVRTDLSAREQDLRAERQWSQVLEALDAQAVSLSPTPDGDAGLRARGLFDPATRRAVIVFERFAAPEGRDYQLWGLHPDGPRSLGVVRADTAGRAIVRLDDAGDPATLQAFAVSLEPAGGSPNPAAPTGPVVMVGRVSP